MKAIGGRLKFKGDTKPKRKREDEATKDYAERKQSGDEVQEEDLEVVKIETGMGRITSSGTTIYGHFTAFTDQLSVGDAIIVQHPQTLVEETKAVRMVLSNTSMSVSSGFSSDLVSTTAFKFAKAPKAAKQMWTRRLRESVKRLTTQRRRQLAPTQATEAQCSPTESRKRGPQEAIEL